MRPNFAVFDACLRRQPTPYLPFFELFADGEIIEAVTGQPLPPAEGETRSGYVEALIAFYHGLGYDYVPCGAGVEFVHPCLEAPDTAGLPRGRRRWQDERQGPIASLEDIDRYPWPQAHTIDYGLLEAVSDALPDGMQVIGSTGGVLETVVMLTGLEKLAYLLYDDPELAALLFERVGTLLTMVHGVMADMDRVGAVRLGDDMGFKTSTILSPQALRRYVFPWQRAIARAVHARGKCLILHSCGNLEAVMDDLIDDVRIDGKHSFEDAIMPVTEAKRRYGDRVALLGGVDVDLLARGSEDEVRQRVRHIIATCAGHGYALGTGNSVANYINPRNYLAMLDEGRRIRF